VKAGVLFFDETSFFLYYPPSLGGSIFFRGCFMDEGRVPFVVIAGRGECPVLIARGVTIARIALLHVTTEERVSAAMSSFEDPKDFEELALFAETLARRARAKKALE